MFSPCLNTRTAFAHLVHPSPHVFLVFYFLFLTNNSVNDLEVVAEILVDALLLFQTCLWNTSKIFGCLHAAGLSAQTQFYFACLAVQITGLNVA